MLNLKKKKWLNKEIDNVYLYGFEKQDIKKLPKNLQKKSLYYLNSNKFQVDNLYHKLLYTSKINNQYYNKYHFDIENQIESYPYHYNKPLFNNNMLKEFVDFCYNNK